MPNAPNVVDVAAAQPDRGVGWDVFVSYGTADAAWVEVLAGRLHQAGLRVFYDRWEIAGGDPVVHRLEEAIAGCQCGIRVFSPESVLGRWGEREYAALITRAVERQLRFIPVLYKDVPLPPFAATYSWVDFRTAHGPVFDQKVTELVRAVRGLPPGAPPAPGALLVPPGDGVRPAGPMHLRLRVDAAEVSVLDVEAGVEARAQPGPMDHRLGHLLDRLWQARRSPGSALVWRRVAHGGEAPVLRVAIEVGEAVADWPWETLVVPGHVGPFVLDAQAQVYRTIGGVAPAPVIALPGPLRILVVLASPDGDGAGPLLDLEAELSTILDAVEPARRSGSAHIRILNQGTLASLAEALGREPFHVLHLSCHAEPGALLLERADGSPHRVSAADLVAAIPAGKRPAVVMLSGCSTALTPAVEAVDPSAPARAAEALPGLARALLAAGVPQVIAMTAPVTDRYATALAGGVYQRLSTDGRPEELAALSHARRAVERERSDGSERDPGATPVEWATPALLLRGPSLPLYQPEQGLDTLVDEPAPVVEGLPLRAVGQFGGRRADLRRLSALLRDPGCGGVLLHGIGGVGKSSLAAELVRLLGGDAGIVAGIVGAANVDTVLAAVGRALFADAVQREYGHTHPQRQVAVIARDATQPWQDRLAVVHHVLRQQRRRLTLVVDNAESNLTADGAGGWGLPDPHLATLLARWVSAPDAGSLVVTSRHPFPLPDAARRFAEHHVGPLSWPETRKLLWRLPALDALPAADQLRAYTDVGGHPRTLEYLDALLRHGDAKFADVRNRMERLLRERGIDRPDRWLAGAGHQGLDEALAQAVTLAVNDALLRQLVEALDERARTLLVGAAGYRQPVDAIALAWQIAGERDPAPDPARDQRLAELDERIVAAQESGQPVGGGLQELGYPAEQSDQLMADVAALRRPPLDAVDDLPDLIVTLTRSGLLAPVAVGGGDDVAGPDQPRASATSRPGQPHRRIASPGCLKAQRCRTLAGMDFTRYRLGSPVRTSHRALGSTRPTTSPKPDGDAVSARTAPPRRRPRVAQATWPGDHTAQRRSRTQRPAGWRRGARRGPPGVPRSAP